MGFIVQSFHFIHHLTERALPSRPAKEETLKFCYRAHMLDSRNSIIVIYSCKNNATVRNIAITQRPSRKCVIEVTCSLHTGSYGRPSKSFNCEPTPAICNGS